MKIAVSSSGEDLDAQIDPRFGRCACFLIVETDDMTFEVFNNENIALGGGAGIQSAQFVASKGALAVITGNCGPNAVRTLAAAGVTLYVGQSGRVKEALERYKNGALRSTNEPNVSDHYGMGQNASAMEPQQGFGRGMGMGRGMGQGMGMGRGKCRGMGMGRGMGQGMGRGMALPGVRSANMEGRENMPSVQELELLREQAAHLKRQMEEIEARIRKLE